MIMKNGHGNTNTETSIFSFFIGESNILGTSIKDYNISKLNKHACISYLLV